MSWTKRLILTLSFLFLAYFVILITIHFMDFKDLFFYLDDWPSWIMLFLLITAIKGIMEWLFKWELHALK